MCIKKELKTGSTVIPRFFPADFQNYYYNLQIRSGEDEAKTFM
jgi:hypothetical protein